MPRFVILSHNHPFPHFDLMLEAAGALRTWRLLEPPAAGAAVAAEPLPDHRLAFLDYEGPLSRGRGEVRRWDSGVYSVEKDGPLHLVAQLSGRRICGRAELTAQADGAVWTFALADPGRLEA